MRRSLFTAVRGTATLTALAFAVSLGVATTGAQAVVVDANPNVAGQSGAPATVTYPTDQGNYVGVALAQSESNGTLAQADVPVVQDPSGAACDDPALPPLSNVFTDLTPPSNGLCFHSGGSVLHGNETFVLTWDPLRRYWETTRNYVEQFLADVAAGSGTLSSPYADTTQYWDGPLPADRAANNSLYGGACIDYGSVGGSACQFGSTNASGAGSDYTADPADACAGAATGTNQFYEYQDGGFGPSANDVCLTDAQIRQELSARILQTGLVSRTKPGYTPEVVLLTPPGVVTCLDSSETLCSANSAATTRFCSYHSQLEVDGTDVPYVVVPWVAAWDQTANSEAGIPAGLENNGCDEPDLATAKIPYNPAPSASTLATDVGARLVSPLSQSQIASIVNPFLNAWFANDGAEINDNGCEMFGGGLDTVTVGTSAQNPYFLQREFNNAGLMESDPNAPACTPLVLLEPTFVVPSAVNQGDEVQFDGSTTVSTLIVPKVTYEWNFGDGTPIGYGPSVVHAYATAGTYSVTLTVTDRGANTASYTQTITVLTPAGLPAPPPATQTAPSGGSSGATSTTTPAVVATPALQVHLQLMPESLRSVLHSGLALDVSSNMAANGIVTVSISRAAARRAHLKGSGATIVIGRGTVSQIVDGVVSLRLHLDRATIRKLAAFKHLTLNVRLALVPAYGRHVTIVVAGRF